MRLTRARQLIVITILAAVIMVVTAVNIRGLYEINKQIRSDLESHLKVDLDTVHAAIRLWVTNTKVELFAWTHDHKIQKLILDLAQQPHSESRRAELDKTLSPLLTIPRSISFLVTDTEGKVLFVSAKDPSAQIRFDPSIVDLAAKGDVVVGMPFHVEGQNVWQTAAAPVMDGAGNISAILVYVLRGNNFCSITKIARTRKSGETYAFNQHGQMITESRFYGQLIRIGLIERGQSEVLNLKIRDPGGNLVDGFQPTSTRRDHPLTLMADQAISGRAGLNLDGYRDYRGVKVVGAWLWDRNLNIGLTTEIDYAEAYRSLHISRAMVLSLMAISFAGAAFVTIILWRDKMLLFKALKSREEFISIASHELRTPITSLKLEADLINQAIKKKQSSQKQLEEMGGVFTRQINRLIALSSNLLDFTRIQAGTLHLEKSKVNLGKLVREIASQVKLTTNTRSEIVCRIDDTIYGNWDPMRIEQVASNMITNAVKFGKDNPILVSVYRQHGRAILSVVDQGVGISKRDLKKLFKPYQRAKSAKSYSGLGLGLYISHQIVKSHGGEIQITSHLGSGTEIRMILPAYPIEQSVGNPNLARTSASGMGK